MPLLRTFVALSICAGLAAGTAGASTTSTDLQIQLDPVGAESPNGTVTTSPSSFGTTFSFRFADEMSPLSMAWQVVLAPDEALQLLADGSVAVVRSVAPPAATDSEVASEGFASSSDGMWAQDAAYAETATDGGTESSTGTASESGAAPDGGASLEAAAAADTEAAAGADSAAYDPALSDPDYGDANQTAEPGDAVDPEADPVAPESAADAPNVEPTYEEADATGAATSLGLIDSAQTQTTLDVVAVVSAPAVWDANGASVPAWFSVSGSTITLTVDASGPSGWESPPPPGPSDGTDAYVEPQPVYGYAFPLDGSSEVVGDPDLTRTAAPTAWPDPTPSFCPTIGKISTFNARGWNTLVDAFAETPATCMRYYIGIPPRTSDGQTFPPGRAQGVRARNSLLRVRQARTRFQAAATFLWIRWNMNRPYLGSARREHEFLRSTAARFRRNMINGGFSVAAGDTWTIDEVPETVRQTPWRRTRLARLLRYLYQPGSGFRRAPGIVWVQVEWPEKRLNDPVDGTETLAQYKSSLKSWTADGGFWSSLFAAPGRPYAQLWGQETYTRCSYVCRAGTTVSQKAARANAYIQHHPRLAFAPGSPATSARRFLLNTNHSLVNAFWRSEVFKTLFDLGVMRRLASLQIYATRSWGHRNAYADRRIGFAWNEHPEGVSQRDVIRLARRIAVAVQGAYSYNGQARYACSRSGTDFSLCNPVFDGSAWHDDWSIFRTW